MSRQSVILKYSIKEGLLCTLEVLYICFASECKWGHSLWWICLKVGQLPQSRPQPSWVKSIQFKELVYMQTLLNFKPHACIHHWFPNDGFLYYWFKVHSLTFLNPHYTKRITIWCLERGTVIIWLQNASWHNMPSTAEICWQRKDCSSS